MFFSSLLSHHRNVIVKIGNLWSSTNKNYTPLRVVFQYLKLTKRFKKRFTFCGEYDVSCTEEVPHKMSANDEKKC